MALPKLTQVELATELAERTESSRADAKIFLEALEGIVHDNRANCVRTTIAGVTIAPALKAATKRRMGRNPQTGDEVPVAAKPASVRIALRADTKLKAKAPSVRTLKANL